MTFSSPFKLIVTYNSADVLEGCLASLRAGAAGVELADVVVADNASKDGSKSTWSRLGGETMDR